jgi:hypothetical protein
MYFVTDLKSDWFDGTTKPTSNQEITYGRF